MTPLATLQSLCGLSNREAAEFLNISEDNLNSYRTGRRKYGAGILRELQELWAEIDYAATEHAEGMIEQGFLDCDGVIEIGYPADDFEAKSLGLPCVGAARQMIGRIIDELIMRDEEFDPSRIKLVPRGSTPATAAAADEHERMKK